jgi:hypothetical protein
VYARGTNEGVRNDELSRALLQEAKERVEYAAYGSVAAQILVHHEPDLQRREWQLGQDAHERRVPRGDRQMHGADADAVQDRLDLCHQRVGSKREIPRREAERADRARPGLTLPARTTAELLLLSLVFGVATSLLPWLLMFPSMGFGLFGRRGPAELLLFRTSATLRARALTRDKRPGRSHARARAPRS